jgi:hypothetical protein
MFVLNGASHRPVSRCNCVPELVDRLLEEIMSTVFSRQNNSLRRAAD